MFTSSPLGPRRGILIATGLLLALVPIACSESASAGGRERKKVAASPLPRGLANLPANPRVVAYLSQPRRFADNWRNRVAQLLPEGPARLRLAQLGAGISLVEHLEQIGEDLTIAGYGDPFRDVPPRWLAVVPAGDAEKLDRVLEEWLADGDSEPQVVAGVRLRRVRFRGIPVYYGKTARGWIATSDRKLVGDFMRPGTTGASGLHSGWNALGGRGVAAFASLDLRGFAALYGGQRELEVLGIERVERVSIALDSDADGMRDRVYFHTPAPHVRVPGLFARPVADTGLADRIPAGVTSFSLWSVDLNAFWKELREVLPPEAASQLHAAQRALKLDIQKDLLAHLGGHMATFSLPDGAAGEATVFALELTDADAFRDTVEALTAGAPVPIAWIESASQARAASTPGGVVGVHDDWLYVCDRGTVLARILSGEAQGGGDGEPARVLGRHAGRASFVAWVSGSALARGQAGMAQLQQAWRMAGSGLAPAMERVVGELPWSALLGAMGDVEASVEPDDGGFAVTVRSGTGLLPLGFAGVVAEGERWQVQLELSRLVPVGEKVSQAQAAYRKQYGNYALNLWELRYAELIDDRTARGIQKDFLYRVQSDGRVWSLEFQNDRTGSRHRYSPAGGLQAVQ